MSDKPVWEEETWRWNDLYPSDVWMGDEGGYLLFEGTKHYDEHNAARARLAACAPEAIRMLLEAEWTNGGPDEPKYCQWCNYIQDEYRRPHFDLCPWLALMQKAGVR